MNWRSLGISLGLILAASVLFSLWPQATQPRRPDLPPPAPPRTVEQAKTPPPHTVPMAPGAAPTPAATQLAAAPEVEGPPTLDAEPDWYQLAAMGLGPADLEPLDGGVLHALSRDGLQGAIAQGLPEIRECYDAWAQQNPEVGGRVKVQFTILEIPGRSRGKVQRVEIGDGGLGHVAMEGCVRNVFKSMRFEAPPHGEMRVSYPLTFEARAK